MPIDHVRDMHMVRPSRPRLCLAFLILFVVYQSAEGLGGRVLHSMPVQAGLLVAFLPAAWLLGRWLGLRGLAAWYLDLRPRWAGLLAGAFALSVLAKAAALAVGEAGGVYRIALLPGLSAAQAGRIALEMLPYTLLPSIAEDVVTRGFLMRATPVLSRRPLFIALSALLFVLNHIYRLSKGPLEWAMLFCFGLAYAAALFYSRSLWPAIGLHWGWNYAGQLGDRLASVELQDAVLGPLLSSLTHLVLLGIVVCATRCWPRQHKATLHV